MNKYSSIITLFSIVFSAYLGQPCLASTLTIIGQNQTVILDTKQLRSLKIEAIEMNYNRAYPNTKMIYQSIKLCYLLKKYHINPANTLEFVAKDHFSVLIPANKVLNCKKNSSIAYLAIEPDEKWPILFNHTNTTAGPYAVIWTNPERSYISDEYWAWSVTKIIEHKKIDQSIVISAPANIPQKVKSKILNGYRIYVNHCSSCHTIKNIGKATIGPDLIYPKTIFDYYPDKKLLKQFIRNPESVRKIPNGRMSGSSYTGLNDSDLEDLIDYFDFIIGANRAPNLRGNLPLK